MARFSMRIVNSFFGTVRVIPLPFPFHICILFLIFLFQKYFPVIVPRILFLNAPGWFFKVLTMYQSFISSTMDVIELVTMQKLLEYVSVDNLVPAIQGTFHFGILFHSDSEEREGERERGEGRKEEGSDGRRRRKARIYYTYTFLCLLFSDYFSFDY
jgi:hypothetical protein